MTRVSGAAVAPPPAPGETSGVIAEEIHRLGLQASHYLAGLAGSFAFGLISFPIFTRVFPVAQYGLIDLAQKTLLLLWGGAKLGLQNAALRFYDGPRFESDAAARRAYFSTLLLGVLVSSGAAALLFVAFARFLPRSLMDGALAALVSLLAVLLLLRSAGSMLWTFLRVEERTKTYNALMVASKAATLGAVCLWLPVLGRHARSFFAGAIVVESLLVAGLGVWLLRRGLLAPSAFDRTLLGASILYGAPLVVYEFSFNVLGSTDRFLIRHFLGGEALGLYSVAYGLAQHANEFLITPLSLALTPIYMRIWNTEGRESTIEFLTVSFDWFLMGAAAILTLAVAGARDLVLVLASAKYAGADALIPPLLAGLLVYTAHLFLAAGLLIHKRTVTMAGILLASAVVNVSLNWLLLPRLGLAGGAFAALLSFSLCTVWLAGASRRLLPLRWPGRACGRYAMAAAAAWLAAWLIETGHPAWNLAGKSTAALGVYLAALYALDARVRRAAEWLTGRRA
jgi:O-antigen/teichoic acid export membrane protein